MCKIVKNEDTVVEVIGRLQGRASSHKNAAEQTNCKKKAEAHWNAYYDLIDTANQLASATFNPKYYSSNKAYQEAVNKNVHLDR